MAAYDWLSRITWIVAITLLPAPGLAQRLTVSPGDVLVAGTTATVVYENADLANQTVEVEISGGLPPSSEKISIKLDAAGKGFGPWLVTSAWRSASFNAPGASEVRIPIRQ
ncbi:MAG: hypothetical protein FJ265_10185 [Planctomycetes bacterium]|nr:hypothetical protein [Planctomycetota bacterium]